MWTCGKEQARIPLTYKFEGESRVGLDTPSENLPQISPDKPRNETPKEQGQEVAPGTAGEAAEMYGSGLNSGRSQENRQQPSEVTFVNGLCSLEEQRAQVKLKSVHVA